MPDVKRLVGRLVAAQLLIFSSSMCQDSPIEVTLLPDTALFPTFCADALAHQLSLSRVTDNREWIGTVGTSLPIAQMETGDLVLQAGVGATVFSRLIKTPGHITVSTVDFKIDLPLDLEVNGVKFRMGYGHISSHYADDAIEQLGRTSISSVKDYVMFASSRSVGLIKGSIYAAVTHLFHNEPEVDKKWQFQIGALVAEVRLLDRLLAYGAVDIKLKQEVGWGTTQSYQAGVKLLARDQHGVRLCYTLRTGLEERGQLYNQRTTANLLSIVLDY